MNFVANIHRVLTQDEFDQFVRNGQPVDYVMAARLVETLRIMFQLERGARLLCSHQSGIYDVIERPLGNLEAGRLP